MPPTDGLGMIPSIAKGSRKGPSFSSSERSPIAAMRGNINPLSAQRTNAAVIAVIARLLGRISVTSANARRSSRNFVQSHLATASDRSVPTGTVWTWARMESVMHRQSGFGQCDRLWRTDVEPVAFMDQPEKAPLGYSTIPKEIGRKRPGRRFSK